MKLLLMQTFHCCCFTESQNLTRVDFCNEVLTGNAVYVNMSTSLTTDQLLEILQGELEGGG